MRISGTKPSLVILSLTKLFQNMESVVPKVSKMVPFHAIIWEHVLRYYEGTLF